MKPSLFSVSYAGFWNQERLGVVDFVRRAASLGYGSVMLMGKRPHLSPLDAQPDLLQAIRAELAHLGVECSVVAAYTDFSGSGAAEVPAVEMQIAYVESLSRLAAQLDCELVRVFTAYENDRIAPSIAWERSILAVQECCDRASAHGVRIAVQNHHDVGVHPDSMLEFLHEVDRPNCTLGFDAWSVALLGHDLYETARRMAAHVSLTTNADYIRLARAHYRPDLVNYETGLPHLVRAVPFGNGFIDYSAFFAGLRDGGFRGVAAYEMCSPLRGGGSRANLDQCSRKYLAWMNEFKHSPARPSSELYPTHLMGERP